MASGSFTGSTSSEYITPRISWSSTANVTTNKSSLTVTFQLKKSSTSTSSTYGTGAWTLTIGDNTYNFSDVITIKTNDTYMSIYSKTVTIAHDDDGTKSVFIKVTGSIPDTTYTSTTLNKTISLDTIPRASALSVPTSVNVYSNLTVTISPASNSYRHKMKFVVDGATKYTSGYIAAGTKTFSYMIPRSWVSGIESKKLTVYLYTYPASGSTAIGTVSKTTTIKVPHSTLTVPTSAYTGSALTVTIGLTNSGTSYRHRIKYVIGNTEKATTAFGDIPTGATSYSYTIPHTWLTNAESATMTVYLYTYNSSYSEDYIARVSKTLKLKVPANIKPSITSVTPTIIGAFLGKYVRGKSQVKLSVSAEPNGGSAINSYIYKGVNIDGSASSYTGTSSTRISSVIQSVGTQKYTVQVKDKRGRLSDAVTTSITIYEYSTPKITSITARRCLADGTLNNDGTYAKVTIKTSYSTVGGENTRTVSLSSDIDNFVNKTIVLKADNTENTYSGVIGGQFKIDTEYTIKAIITDKSTTHENSVALEVPQRTLNIAKYGNGIAIGGLSTVISKAMNGEWYKSSGGLFECHWASKFNELMISTGGIRTEADGSSNRYFEARRTNPPSAVDDEHKNVKMQMYVGDAGYPTIRNQYSTDNGETWNTRNFLRLQDDGIYADGWRIPEIQRGIISITPSAANTPTSKIVTFNKAFTGSPVMTLTPHTSVPGTTVLGTGSAERSNTGFTAWLTRTNTTETNINWIAVY